MSSLVRVVGSVLLFASSLSFCFAQTPGSSSSRSGSSDGLKILQQACQGYSQAKSYHIEEVEESNTRSEFRREWLKTLLTAIQAPDNRYHYESHTANGSRVRVSDGKTEWIEDVENNAYMQKPVSPDGPTVPKILFSADLAEAEARKLRQTLADIASEYQSAEILPDDSMTVQGKKVPCAVVKLSSRDLKKPMKPGTWFEKTVWIDKEDMTVRKIFTREHGSEPFTPAIFEDREITELYPVVELNRPIAASVFTFVPPKTAKLVEEFENPFSGHASALINKPAPEIKLKSVNGQEISLKSFHGKPVLIDFWATWCLPCVASLPQLSKLYGQAKDAGLVFLSVDEDKHAKTAAAFVASRKLPWPDFHDEGDIGKAFQKTSIPLTVLVNQEGKIVYYESGYRDDDFSDLRAAIAKLGPGFAAIGASSSSK
ncbi:MAG TPA: redoxin family protein [Candidatus Angelobacter sp.]|nr:redoxin family protein [Candidatus Angelobacter sp.]